MPSEASPASARADRPLLDDDAHAVRCMEVWGGNRAIDDAISMPGLDAWVYSRPFEGDAGGGDVHYISVCAAGAVARLGLADVAGHGAAVDTLAVTLRKLMRKYINTPDQSAFARRLSAAMSEAETDGRFATALLMTYFAPTDQLVICNAGHPPPLLRRAGDGRWSALTYEAAETTGRDRPVGALADLPLGVIEPTDYRQFVVTLEPGDLVLLYTDALPEARLGDGPLLGEEGLRRLVEEIDVQDPSALVPELLRRLSAFRGGTEADDDLTTILLHHNAAAPPRQTLGDRLGTLARLLGVSRT